MNDSKVENPRMIETKTEMIYRDYNPYKNIYQGNQKRVLFVCSMGLLRSPTAAVLGAKLNLNTRSCGSSSAALIPLSNRLIQWADKIVFMNWDNYLEVKVRYHGTDLLESINHLATVWNIDDNYNFMEDGLLYVLETKLEELAKELE